MLQKDSNGQHVSCEMTYAGGPASTAYKPRETISPPVKAYMQPNAATEASGHSRVPMRDRTPTSSHSSTPVRQPSPSLHVHSVSQPSPQSSPQPASTRDTEKGRLHPPRSNRNSTKGTLDPEKANHDHRSMRSCPSSNARSHYSTTIYEEEDDEDVNDSDPSEHAVWTLAYLSLLAPLLSAAIALYTFLAIFVILLLSPLCFCTARQPLRVHFTRFLVPSLRPQLRLIYSLYDTSEATNPSSVPMLVLVNLTAPIVAIGVAVAVWVSAAFWVFAKILGNPGGKDERNDGRESVLGVRRFWEGFLIRGLR